MPVGRGADAGVGLHCWVLNPPQMRMKWLTWLGAVLACVLAAAALGLYKYNEIQSAIARAEAYPEPAEAVEVYEVQAIEQRATLSVSGEVVAIRSATLQNELGGRIVAVGFAPGARVEAGQVLLQLDVAQERAQLAEAVADQTMARLAFERAQRLVITGAGSVEQRDQARAQRDAAQARSAALTALIDKKTLRAPFAALSSLHQLEVGQFLDAGTEITQLIGVSDFVWVDFALPQDVTEVQPGSTVEVRAAEGGPVWSAEVIARDAAVSQRSRNLRLRARLQAAAAPTLLPGMLVRVKVPLGDRQMAVVVPPMAIRRHSTGASVYVLEDVTEQGRARVRARRRPVQLAALQALEGTADLVVVLDGIQPGERIAGVGAFKLRDGALVMPLAPDPDVQKRVVGR